MSLDRRALETSNSDLAFLSEDWTQDSYSLRRSSTVLRYLLVDSPRWLLKAWRHASRKGQPRVAAPSLELLLKPFPPVRQAHLILVIE